MCESDWCWRFGYPPTDRVTNRSLHVDHHRPGLFTHPETPSIYWYNLIVSKSAADVCYMSTCQRLLVGFFIVCGIFSLPLI